MELKKQTEGHLEFANFDDPSSTADGQSNGASGADTPMTVSTPGQPKIKLKFNNNLDGASDMNGTDFGDDE